MQKPYIAVIGLGYVGLPLARLLSTKFKTIGYDLSHYRVDAINNGHDSTGEVSDKRLQEALQSGFKATNYKEDIKECNTYIIAVPTPVDVNNHPDLKPLLDASRLVGEVISEGDVVIYESTVYPGMTEEVCVPVVEKVSGLRYNEGFFAGYSPERINPGDKVHTVENICKVTSGSTPEIAEYVDYIYDSVLKAKTHKASSIKVAEASKIVENSQRDVNIAFVNEIAKICGAMGIDTIDVLEAASTKWNFINMRPGLVGGHCIGVDPYYLIQKAQAYGVMPRIMNEARRLNDAVGEYVAKEVIKLMNLKGIIVRDAKILILGFTFKENCPDIRNTKVVDIIEGFSPYTSDVTICDPYANANEVKQEYNLRIISQVPEEKYDVIVHAVAHTEFMSLDIIKYAKDQRVIYDVKGSLDRTIIDGRL